MKKLLAVLLVLFTCELHSQIFGIAGTNTPQTLVPEVRAAMTALALDTLGFCIRDDKTTTHYTEQEVQNIIDWNNEMNVAGKVLSCIYTFQCSGKSISDNFYDYNLLVAAGVRIPVVKLGNENYFKEAGNNSDFNNYLSFANPIIAHLTELGFNGIFIIPVSGGNTTWDIPVWNFIKDKPNYQLDPHFYWGRKDLECFNQLVGTDKDLKLPSAVVGLSYLPLQDGFYSDMYTQVTTSTLLQDEMSYYTSAFPGKRLYITEFGPAGNVGNLQNAMGFQATEDWFYNTIQWYPSVAYCLKFNGPSPSGTGMNSPKSSKDDPTITGSYLKRLSYYTLYNFIRNKKSLPVSQITKEGRYVFTYHNMTRFDKPLTIDVAQGYEITSITYNAIHGDNFYSGSGVCQWWANGSLKTYQVSGSQDFVTGKDLSYGYIHVTVIKSFIPLYGCTDNTALNYNPSANTDDGSCYYYSDCACKDITALNYDADAPCENNSLCEYAPEVCYKERIIFKWLGCKLDPNCKVDNCKK